MSYDFFMALSETAGFSMVLFRSSWVKGSKDLSNSPFFSWQSWFCFEFYTRDTDLPAGDYSLKKNENKVYNFINTLKRWEEYI